MDMSRGDIPIYALSSSRTALLMVVAFVTFEKSFYVPFEWNAYLCGFQTFTFIVLLCKLLTVRSRWRYSKKPRRIT